MKLQKVINYLEKIGEDIKAGEYNPELEICGDGSGIIKGLRGETITCFNNVDELEEFIDNEE